MRIDFTVRGNPKALKRHRTYRRGSKLIQVDPSKDEKQDFLVLAHAHAPREPITSGVGLYLWFYMPIPKSWPKYKKKEAGLKLVPHEKRPDLSNLVKFCEDALLGVFYSDDSLISRTTAFKLYSDTPRTHCIIEYQEDDEIIEIRDKVRDVLNGIAPINDDLLGEIQKISLYACPTCNGRGYFMDSDDYKEFEIICDCVVDKTEV